MPVHRARPLSASEDTALAGRIGRGEPDAFEALMRRHNAKLFRVARAILRDDAEAEDAVQDAYLDAYRHIGDFRGDASLGTWLTRIAINHALMRARRQKSDRVVVPFGGETTGTHDPMDPPDDRAESAQSALMRAEVRQLVERRIDELPVAFRTVFVMRDVEDMTVQETADCLSIPAATVRTRLFRARALLREALARDLDVATVDVFGFAGERCDRIVMATLERARQWQQSQASAEPETTPRGT
jgi:RNA polymerase sigma-70 factor, ECF subfamily